jgi:hypothetical protein
MNPDRIGLVPPETEVRPPKRELQGVTERRATDQLDARPRNEPEIREPGARSSTVPDAAENHRAARWEARQSNRAGGLVPCAGLPGIRGLTGAVNEVLGAH